MKRAYASTILCLALGGGPVLAGCSDGAAERKADCAKISSALATTRDPTAEQVLDALRKVRPELKNDDLAEQVDTVIASGGKDRMSDEETFRFARATEEIRSTCRQEPAAFGG
ncbi:hypothetical protein E1264_31925 [Actinomadura sp. KC216]|uniref:hypothetical protein n=1 Tax=Actinomadura sp. KC216 TaxID=2530370 RepID=UPI001050BFA5|nr:hypothetical protein [Actinomadura sp. KC216]TDB82018.1 hypothetical protein E1264_31925 [Actinomadura sp. KC216]